jgi:hypothetical protein
MNMLYFRFISVVYLTNRSKYSTKISFQQNIWHSVMEFFRVFIIFCVKTRAMHKKDYQKTAHQVGGIRLILPDYMSNSSSSSSSSDPIVRQI